MREFLRQIEKEKFSTVKASVFTFDSTIGNVITCKTPSNLLDEIDKQFETDGGKSNSLEDPIKTLEEILETNFDKVNGDCMNYAMVFVGEEAEYPGEAVKRLWNYLGESELKFFLNVITAKEHCDSMTKVALALHGVHYTFYWNSELTRVFTEALSRNLKSD